jgi:hypothetical protein
MSSIIWLVVVGAAVWVGFDARSLGVRRGRLGGGVIDMSVFSWVVCCIFLFLIAFPCYLVARSKYQAMRDAPAGTPAAIPAPAAWPVAVPAVYVPTQATAPPQLSPDGHWWWDGTQWLPAASAQQHVG